MSKCFVRSNGPFKALQVLFPQLLVIHTTASVMGCDRLFGVIGDHFGSKRTRNTPFLYATIMTWARHLRCGFIFCINKEETRRVGLRALGKACKRTPWVLRARWRWRGGLSGWWGTLDEAQWRTLRQTMISVCLMHNTHSCNAYNLLITQGDYVEELYNTKHFLLENILWWLNLNMLISAGHLVTWLCHCSDNILGDF